MEMDGHGGLMIIVDHPWRKPEAKSQERMVMCSSQDGETNQKIMDFSERKRMDCSETSGICKRR